MPLSPAEEQELAALQASPQPQQATKQPVGLSPDEENELAQLQARHGGTRHPQPGDEDYETSNAKEQSNQSALPGRIGTGLKISSSVMAPELGWMASLPVAAGASMADQKLRGQDISLGQTAKDTALNGVMPNAVAGLSQLLGKGGDWAMQKAVGLKKFMPGVGRSLADEGVWGSKSMMTNQVESGMSSRGQEISDLAKNLDEVPSDVASQRVLGKASKLIQADGTVAPDEQSAYDYYSQRADDIAQRGGDSGTVSGDTAASARSASGRIARKAGAYRDNPAETLKAEANRAEQSGWSQALKDSYASKFPGQTNKMAEADKAYGALATASRPLNTPASIPQTLAKAVLGSGVGGGLGYMAGGARGAMLGALLTTPAGMSTGGRGMLAGSSALANPAVQSSVPALMDLLTQKKREEQ